GCGLDPARQPIIEQLATRRRQLSDAKPLGKRLDGALAAFERAKASEAAALEVAQLESDVAELQQQVAAARAKETPKPVAINLGEQLQATIKQLEEYGTVSPEGLAEAKKVCEETFAKFQATLDMAARAAAQEAGAPARPRFNHKAPPVEPVPMAPLGRHAGKQPAKYYISDYGNPAKKPKQQARAYAAVSGICMRSKITMLDELTEGRHYTMVSAAADAHGTLGVQLWVKRSLPIVALQAESPRLLHAVVGKRGCEVGCLVEHALHSMTAEPDRLQWWADLDRLVGKIFSRIDYALSTAELAHWRRLCEPLPDVFLTLNAKQDRGLVAMETLACYGTPMSPPPTTFKVNKYNLDDPVQREPLQQCMWQFPCVGEHVHIDDHLELLCI
ncbi:unnamed protein product, partial [Prorocentrum cordatum]